MIALTKILPLCCRLCGNILQNPKSCSEQNQPWNIKINKPHLKIDNLTQYKRRSRTISNIIWSTAILQNQPCNMKKQFLVLQYLKKVVPTIKSTCHNLDREVKKQNSKDAATLRRKEK